MVFRLFLSAQDTMEKIRWSSPSREVMEGVKFVDGIREEEDASLGSYTKFAYVIIGS
jgi:hypothetical protein